MIWKSVIHLTVKPGNVKLICFIILWVHRPKISIKIFCFCLLAIYNTKFVKKYDIDKVLTPVVQDINKLYEGYRIKLLLNKILVFRKVLMCLGDTLGQNLWGGFKEGVGVSKKNAGIVIANLMICNCCLEKIY